MKKIILILIVITTVVYGCNKTEYTLNRIYGQYSVKAYTVNDIDSTSLCLDSVGNSFEFFYDEDHNSKGLWINGSSKYNYYGLFYIIVWELSDNNKMIKIKSISTNNVGTGPFGQDKMTNWDILTLTKTKLYIKTSYNNKDYYLKLLKQ